MQRAGTNYIYASNASGDLRLGSGGSFSRLNIASNGDISFYEDTATTAKFFWDASAESLGIGTSSPSANLEIASTSTIAGARLTTSAGSDSEIEFINTSSGNHTWAVGQDFSNSNAFSIAYANAVGASLSANGKVIIDTSGRVGIGTSSPSANVPLTAVYSSTSQFHFGGLQAGISNNTYYNGSAWVNRNASVGGSILQMNTSGAFNFRRAGTGANPTVSYSMTLDSSGRVGIGTS